MKDRKVVRIKTWDELIKDYSIDDEGDIIINDNFFTTAMESNMPKNRILTVEEFKAIANSSEYSLLWLIGTNPFTIEPEFIDEFLNPKDYPQYFI